MKKKFTIVSIIGAGSWGTTLAVILSKNPRLKIILWSPFKAQVKKILSKRENKDFLAGIKIPKKVKVTSELNVGLAPDIIILAIPVKFLRGILKKIRRQKVNLQNKIFLSLAKGIEIKNLKMPSQIVQEELKIKNLAVLSGPTIAREVVRGVPTVAIVASKKRGILVKLQNIFIGSNLRLYRGYDVVGVELAGALKNIIALACGISDGLGFGTNTKATLVTRGLRELIRFALFFGAKPSTFYGISGFGDLVTTCFSSYSRNRFVGEEIGKGKTLKQILKRMKMVAEGVTTVRSVYALSKKYKIDMPITSQVFLTLYKNKSPRKAVRDLMRRPLKAE